MKPINVKTLAQIMMLLLAVNSVIAAVKAPATAPLPPSPLKMLKEASDTARTMIDQERQKLVKAHKITAKQSLPFSNTQIIIEKALIPHIDVTHIVQASLPPKVWQQATAQQQTQLVTAVKNLLIGTYSAALANYKNEQIQFFTIRGGYAGLKSVQVKSKILQQGGPGIEVKYAVVLNENNNQWSVTDIIIEGVSLQNSFRSQFSAALKPGGVEHLLKVLDQHNAEKTTTSKTKVVSKKSKVS